MQFIEKDFVTLPSAPSGRPATLDAERLALAAESLRESGRLRLQVHGESMLPSLWPGDVVEIASCPVADVHPGEIVLAWREGRFFLHRFLARSQPDSFVLRGDSMPGPDPPFPNEALLGRLVRYAGQRQRQNRVQSEDQDRDRPVLPLRPWSWAIGQLLCHCGPACRLALKLHDRRKRRPREIQNAEEAALRATNVGAMNLGAPEDFPAS